MEGRIVAFKATLRQVNSITIVDMSGQITLGEGVVQLRELIRQRLGKGEKHLLLNLADVTYIDTTGMGDLVRGFATVSNQGGHLKLLNLSGKVKELMQVTRLYAVFEIYDDEGKAISSFGT